jgi:hypothetical protein
MGVIGGVTAHAVIYLRIGLMCRLGRCLQSFFRMGVCMNVERRRERPYRGLRSARGTKEVIYMFGMRLETFWRGYGNCDYLAVEAEFSTLHTSLLEYCYLPIIQDHVSNLERNFCCVRFLACLAWLINESPLEALLRRGSSPTSLIFIIRTLASKFQNEIEAEGY